MAQTQQDAWRDASHHDAYGMHHAADGRPGGGRLQAVSTGIGALVSVGLVVGVLVWGYSLAVRDVTGVPVVQALEGPMRVAPEDPGGMRAAYQGLSVNAVAAEGLAADLPDRIRLAPPPVDLVDLTDPGDPFLDWQALPDGVPDEVVTAMPAVFYEEDAVGPAGARILPASVPGVSRSPVPPVRPAGDLMAAAAAQAAVASLTPDRSLDVDPATLTVGTRLVQLGTYPDDAAARADWERLATRYPALMDERGRVIQQAEAGGGVFYRLRAHGFADDAEARRFCAVLLEDQATCIPVLIR